MADENDRASTLVMHAVEYSRARAMLLTSAEALTNLMPTLGDDEDLFEEVVDQLADPVGGSAFAQELIPMLTPPPLIEEIVLYMNSCPEGATLGQIAQHLGQPNPVVSSHISHLRETGWLVRGVKGLWLRTSKTEGPYRLVGGLDPVIYEHLKWLYQDRGSAVFKAEDLGVLMGKPNGASISSALKSLHGNGFIAEVLGVGWVVVPEALSQIYTDLVKP